ncbi:hypothetical protein A3B05_00215 [Candidatus Giovannonibacteria bacterium RIFCSPLOWO2_01_FULL_43_160]|uniref:Uncharacterized protein n=2 Tax=Candidatus Giovannoniibacteriota TaxID=1752738 RepID=A0A0G1IWT2_9BACT|nr:MAG: hypothetical protein UV72_C0001G0031 [Candidatus Giovannonibacteria bacterium GW2011_GWB1_43_13]KKS99766.1 MAG: hypothetical protein UV75_C0002G0147 [Candidatus Giovannonibacteria bacterium GW2011_GWA1_43_15]KKT20701.1 MAG: hypothetical protein UW05_C0032G0006 [Candidatus Giovannonibacteria bacterium GW2011_GWC2_43_8]KKT63851.1 MAG: hypothetical protein UW55_C0001G0144 [Candidatus Giovannonibacteria bacterium GW2011_GWA2_44_26]OGF58175.1 MAG: hypothetical protein A2652_02585 [Candidatus
MHIIDKILGALHLNFLNRKNSPSTKQVIKKANVDGDVVGRDKITLANSISDNLLSNEEKMVLKYLDLLRIQNLPPRDKTKTILSKLEIKDCSTLNDSKYIKIEREIEGEYFVMTSNGIRHMDNLPTSEKASIMLPKDKKLSDEVMAKQWSRMEENKRNQWRNSAK